MKKTTGQSLESLQADHKDIQRAYAQLREANALLARREVELQTNQDRLELALKSGNLAWWEWDIIRNTVRCSDTKITMLGYEVEGFPEGFEGFTEKLHPEDYESVMQNMRDHLSGKTEAYDIEYRIRKKDGSYIWYWDKGRIVARTADGRPELITGIVTNIDEQKRNSLALAQSLREREMLIREVHHRVKNNFQMISALLELQLADTPDQNAHSALLETKNRITSMALIHRGLYETEKLAQMSVGRYLERLIDNIVASYTRSQDPIRIERSIQEIFLPADIMIPLALILNELLTNSFKYAFPHMDSPSAGLEALIRIELTSTQGKTRLLYSDNGQGFPPDVLDGRRNGMGMRLVSSLARQIGAHITLSNDPGGTVELAFLIHTKKQD